MNDHELTADFEKRTFMVKHSFLIFIILSIFIASVIVVISMAMYNGSGAAQLDLSRPGYKSVRSQATTNDIDFQNYSGNGKLDKDEISNFQSIYEKQSKNVKAVDAFGGDPLSPEALGISAPPEL